MQEKVLAISFYYSIIDVNIKVYLVSKKGGKQQMKKDQGITLIALVITIIILIILAAITINAVFGENGLIVRVNQAKQDTINKAADERAGLVAIDARVNRELNPSAGFEVSVTKAISDNGNQFEYLGLIESNTKAKIRDKKTGREYTIEDGSYKITYIGGGSPSTPAGDLDWLEIGAYVAYSPGAASSVTIEENESGWITTQTFNQDENALSTSIDGKWRVIDKGETTVTLISAVSLNSGDNGGGLTIDGAVGYNKLITTLNKICSNLYGNIGKGATARSVTGEDIDKLTGIADLNGSEFYELMEDEFFDFSLSYTRGEYVAVNEDEGVFAPDSYITETNQEEEVGTGVSEAIAAAGMKEIFNDDFIFKKYRDKTLSIRKST